MLTLACLLQEAGHILGFHRYLCHLHQELLVCRQMQLESDPRKFSPLWGTHGILFYAVFGSVAFDASLYCSYAMSLDKD